MEPDGAHRQIECLISLIEPGIEKRTELTTEMESEIEPQIVPRTEPVLITKG